MTSKGDQVDATVEVGKVPYALRDALLARGASSPKILLAIRRGVTRDAGYAAPPTVARLLRSYA